MQWFAPVISTLWKAGEGGEDHLSPGVQEQPGQHRPHLYKKLKKKKKSQVQWCTLVVSATQEAQVGGSLEPGRSRLQ